MRKSYNSIFRKFFERVFVVVFVVVFVFDHSSSFKMEMKRGWACVVLVLVFCIPQILPACIDGIISFLFFCFVVLLFLLFCCFVFLVFFLFFL